jgi:hypothetical protein
MAYAHKILIGRPDCKRLLGRPKRRFQGFKEATFAGVD